MNRLFAYITQACNNPYTRLLKNIEHIDTDFFELITRDENVLPPELNLGLKDKVVNHIKNQTNQLLFDSSLIEQILADISNLLKKEGTGKEAVQQMLSDTAKELRKYAQDRLLFIPTPNYNEAELEKMYEQAREVTLLEHIMQNNRTDVIAFYHALMDRTEWECKVLVEEKTSQFLVQLADRLIECAETENAINKIPKGYMPQPIPTDDIKLPEELEVLVEKMAKNVHEVWAATRIKQGWTYGEKRDDRLKKHPCLVPYENLPEEEKVYDRETCVGTLKLILKLGFRITKEQHERKSGKF